MKRGVLVCGILLTVCVTLGSTAVASPEAWVETFDTGVGRFSVTRGGGDANFAYDVAEKWIAADFIRRDVFDVRLAPLAEVYDEEAWVRFSFDLTPLARTGVGSRPMLGLFDSATGKAVGCVEVECDPQAFYKMHGPAGAGLHTTGHAYYDLNETYHAEMQLNGPANEATLSVWHLAAGGDLLLLSETLSFPEPGAYSFDSIGMWNIPEQAGTHRWLGGVDNFAFEVVPEPATLALLAVGGLMVFHKRRTG